MRFGGTERWAPEMEVARSGVQSKTRWTYARMKAELATLTDGKTRWPTRPDFRNAGMGCLYEAIMRRGARPQLAADLGLELPTGAVCAPTRWTDEVIEAELNQFLEGRTRWPTAREFAQAGLLGLWRSARRYGTLERWRQRYELPLREKGATSARSLLTP
jgi:hypothetical protein